VIVAGEFGFLAKARQRIETFVKKPESYPASPAAKFAGNGATRGLDGRGKVKLQGDIECS
jgi:hypothetical protein